MSSAATKSFDDAPSTPTATNYTAPDSNYSTVDVSADASVHGDSVIREGAWETELFCCLDTTWGAVLNAFLGWCLPCITIAQVSQRLGVANYWLVLLVVFVLFAAERIIDHYFYWEGYRYAYLWIVTDASINVIYSASTSEELHDENQNMLYLLWCLLIVYGMWALVGIAAGITMTLATWMLRSRVRARFGIRGWCVVDGFIAIFCSCCAVAQMARHLQIQTKRTCSIGPVDTLPAFSQ